MALVPTAPPKENARGLVVILKENWIALAADQNQNVSGLAATLNQSVIGPAVVPRTNESVLVVAPKENGSRRVKERSLENDHVVDPKERETDPERGLVVRQREIEKVPERGLEVSPRKSMTGLAVHQESAGIALGVDQILNRKDLPIVDLDLLPQGKMVKGMLDLGLHHRSHLLLKRRSLFLQIHSLPLLAALGLVLVPQSRLCCEVDLYVQC